MAKQSFISDVSDHNLLIISSKKDETTLESLSISDELSLALTEYDDQSIVPDDGVNPIEISTQSIKLTWNAPTLKDSAYSISSYRITARRLAPRKTGFTPVILDTKSNECVATIVALDPGTWYQFQVVALTWRGHMVPESSQYSTQIRTLDKDYDFAWFFERPEDCGEIWRPFLDSPVALPSSLAQLPITGEGVLNIELTTDQYYAGKQSLAIDIPQTSAGGVYTDVTVPAEHVCVVRARVCHRRAGPGCKLIVWQFFGSTLESEPAPNNEQHVWEQLQVKLTTLKLGRLRIAIMVDRQYHGRVYVDAVDVKTDDTPEDIQAKRLEKALFEPPQSKKVTVEILRARNVQIKGKLGLFSPFMAMRWDGRVVGRTLIKPNFQWNKPFTFTLNPSEEELAYELNRTKRGKPKGALQTIKNAKMKRDAQIKPSTAGPSVHQSENASQRTVQSSKPGSKPKALTRPPQVDAKKKGPSQFSRPVAPSGSAPQQQQVPPKAAAAKPAPPARPKVPHTDLHLVDWDAAPPAKELTGPYLPQPIFGNLPPSVFAPQQHNLYQAQNRQRNIQGQPSVTAILNSKADEGPEDLFPFLGSVADSLLKKIEAQQKDDADADSLPSTDAAAEINTSDPKSEANSPQPLTTIKSLEDEIKPTVKAEQTETKRLDSPLLNFTAEIIARKETIRPDVNQSEIVSELLSTSKTEEPQQLNVQVDTTNKGRIQLMATSTMGTNETSETELENASLDSIEDIDENGKGSTPLRKSSLRKTRTQKKEKNGDPGPGTLEPLKEHESLEEVRRAKLKALETPVDTPNFFPGSPVAGVPMDMLSVDVTEEEQMPVIKEKKRWLRLELMDQPMLDQSMTHAYLNISEKELLTSLVGRQWYKLKSIDERQWCGDVSLVIRNYDPLIQGNEVEFGFVCRQLMIGSESQRENALKEIILSLDIAAKEGTLEMMRVQAEMAECRVIDEVIAHLHVKRRCELALQALQKLLTVPDDYLRKPEGFTLQKQLYSYCINRGVTFVLADNLCGTGKYPNEKILDFLVETFRKNGRALIKTIEQRPKLFDKIIEQIETPSGDVLMKLIGEEDNLPKKLVRMYERHRLKIPMRDGYWRSRALHKIGKTAYVPQPSDEEEKVPELQLSACQKCLVFLIKAFHFLKRYGAIGVPAALAFLGARATGAYCSLPLNTVVTFHNVMLIGMWLFYVYMKGVLTRMTDSDEKTDEQAAFYVWCCLGCIAACVHFGCYAATILFTFTLTSSTCSPNILRLGMYSTVFLGAQLMLYIFWVGLKAFCLRYCVKKDSSTPKYMQQQSSDMSEMMLN